MKLYYEHAGITIYHGDCRDVLPFLCGDVVLTDPPYNTQAIGANRKQYVGGPFSMSAETYRTFCADWFGAALTITERVAFTPGIRHVWDYPPAITRKGSSGRPAAPARSPLRADH